jgi:hypothetical protein
MEGNNMEEKDLTMGQFLRRHNTMIEEKKRKGIK